MHKTILAGHFSDAAVYDSASRSCLSIRDGVLEYLASELGVEADPGTVVRVWRSPATVANAALGMVGIPITDNHVGLDVPPPTDGGAVQDVKLVDVQDPSTQATLGVRNNLVLSDTLRIRVESGKRELSLGYHASLVPHDVYDYEQQDIVPHHLAVVDRGRCGPMCSFIDRRPSAVTTSIGDEDPMKIHKAFRDAEGALNLQQIVELATALPEAIKAVPVDQLQELMPALQQIVEAAKGVVPAPEAEPEQPEMDADPESPEPPPEKQEGMDAAAVQVLIHSALVDHGRIIDKARQFLTDGYSFDGKTGVQIMRDALATETSEKFTDAELPMAFRLLQKRPSSYQTFGDANPDPFTALKDKEL